MWTMIEPYIYKYFVYELYVDMKKIIYLYILKGRIRVVKSNGSRSYEKIYL